MEPDIVAEPSEFPREIANMEPTARVDRDSEGSGQRGYFLVARSGGNALGEVANCRLSSHSAEFLPFTVK